MEKLIDWINESEKYEFCRSYGISAAGEIIDRQEDYYISLLGTLHDILHDFYQTQDSEHQEKLKKGMLGIVKGLLLYSQKETLDAFHGVRQWNNQLYVAALYYLCDYAAVASWAMKGIRMDDYEDSSGQLLSFIVTGGESAMNNDVRKRYIGVFKDVEEFILNGDDALLEKVVTDYNTKYQKRVFDSPTDFYMTSVLRCVLKKFQSDNICRTHRGLDADFDWTTL
ncbi:MAG: hypothetical protein K2L79_01050, partial [Bacteroidales bacterium]|nr:hypothetical protein [Bacteroidales bacterium]